MLKRYNIINVNILSGLVMLCGISANGQTISNTGASVSINNSTVVSSASVTNSSGTIVNNGTLNLSANYSNSGTTQGNGNYFLGGNWTNNGIFTPGTSSFTFNGSATQILNGSVVTPFYNIIVNGAGISLSQNVSFTKVLTLSSGGVVGSDTMVLISNASGTGRVAPVGATVTQAQVTAMFTVQRYENQRTTANYTTLSSPVVNTTIGDWNINNRSPKFYMSGVGGPDGNAGSYVSVKKYNETTAAYNNITAYSAVGINYAVKQGEGIYLWEGTSMSTMVAPFSFNTHGSVTVGNISMALTYTSGKGNGFNLIGNPYASPIDWATFLASNSTLQSSFYIFEQDGSWHVFTSGSIPMEQGFGVITSSNTIVNFKESHKTTVDNNLLRPDNFNNTATFTLSDNVNDFSCPTTISFSSDYSKNYNPQEDAYFMKSYLDEAPQVFTTSIDNKNLALNKLPDADSNVNVSLTTLTGIDANYTLTANNISNITSYNCILLMDADTTLVLNNFLDNPTYTFNGNAGGEHKFIVRFSKLASGQTCNSAGSAANDGVNIYPCEKGAAVNFRLPQEENVNITVLNLLGQPIWQQQYAGVQDNTFIIPLPTVEAVYIVRVETQHGMFTKKLFYK